MLSPELRKLTESWPFGAVFVIYICYIYKCRYQMYINVDIRIEGLDKISQSRVSRELAESWFCGVVHEMYVRVYIYIHTCLDIDINIKMLSLVSRTGGVTAFRRGICNIYTCVYIYVYVCVYIYIRVCINIYTCIDIDIDIQKKIMSRKWWSHGLLARYV